MFLIQMSLILNIYYKGARFDIILECITFHVNNKGPFIPNQVVIFNSELNILNANCIMLLFEVIELMLTVKFILEFLI